MKLVYFASIREKIGLDEEVIALPAGLRTVCDLIRWLESRGDNYAHAFQPPELVRIALDHEHAGQDSPLHGVGEIAFFPPMTGG